MHEVAYQIMDLKENKTHAYKHERRWSSNTREVVEIAHI